jgi:hypothetical protein
LESGWHPNGCAIRVRSLPPLMDCQCCAPAEIDGMTAGGAEFEATHVERCGGLPVAEIRH